MGNDVLWDIDDLAAYLKTPVATIYYLRYRKKGPPAVKVGRELRWDPEVVRKWLAERMEEPASDDPTNASPVGPEARRRADPAA